MSEHLDCSSSQNNALLTLAEAIALREQFALLERENTTLQSELERCRTQAEQLEASDRVLAATAEATNALITITNFDRSVNTALQILGESLQTDRVSLIENSALLPDLASTRWQLLYEWTSAHACTQLADPVAQGSYEGIEEWYERLSQGQSLSYLLEDMPKAFRSRQAALGVNTLHVVPIFVEGKWWGIMKFDDCQSAKQQQQSELAVLRVAADCIGSAIQRQRTQQARLQAEQERAAELAKANDALKLIAREQEQAAQQRAAQLTKANVTLKKTLDVLATEHDLDRTLGHVLQVMSDQLESSSSALWLFNPSSNKFQLHLVHLNGSIIPAIPENVDRLMNQWTRDRDMSRDLTLKDHIRDRRPVVYDVEHHQKLTSASRKFFQKLGVKTMLGVPLILGSEIVGSIAVRFSDRRHLQCEELELIQALAHQATLVIQLLRMAETARQAVVLEERNRLASEIHDTMAQAFSGISIQLGVAKRIAYRDPEEVQKILDRASNLAQAGLTEARRSVWELYSGGTQCVDLAQELADSVERLTSGISTCVKLNIQDVTFSLPAVVSMNLLRIGQEALHNALKHAQSTTIWIDLTCEAEVVSLSVRDDGCGFSLPASQSNVSDGFGLLGMHQRAERIGAQLMLTSHSGQGTEVLVYAPLSLSSNDAPS